MNLSEKHDKIPEIWEGHNVADYIDPDIMQVCVTRSSRGHPEVEADFRLTCVCRPRSFSTHRASPPPSPHSCLGVPEAPALPTGLLPPWWALSPHRSSSSASASCFGPLPVGFFCKFLSSLKHKGRVSPRVAPCPRRGFRVARDLPCGALPSPPPRASTAVAMRAGGRLDCCRLSVAS